MNKFAVLVLALLMLNACTKHKTDYQVVAVTHKPVIAVYPVWEHSADNLDAFVWDYFSHIAIASIYPMADGNLLAQQADAFIGELVAQAHRNNKQVIISIGGAGDGSKGFLSITKDEQITQKFVANVVDYVDKYALDGVDIDWEYWSFQNEQGIGGNDPVESKQLVELLSLLREALPEKVMLTADISPGDWVGLQYLPQMQAHVDYINLMAFDFTGQWSQSEVKHHSDYDTFVRALEHTIKRGFEANKLLVGVPIYGKDFVDGDTDIVTNLDYIDIASMPGFSEQNMAVGRFEDIYFESPSNATKKARLIAKDGYAGVFFFHALADYPNNSIVEATREYLLPIEPSKHE